MALQQHAVCSTYSCRYLHDWHSLFEIEKETDTSTSTLSNAMRCNLCTFQASSYLLEEVDSDCLHALQSHAESHDLRACTQRIFTSKIQFLEHMRIEHSAVHLKGINWQSTQFLEAANGGQVVRTWLVSTKNAFCDTNPADYHGICSVATPVDQVEVESRS